MSFERYRWPCNNHHDQSIQHLSNPKILLCTFVVNCCRAPSPKRSYLLSVHLNWICHFKASYKWNHLVYILLCLTSLAQDNVLKLIPVVDYVSNLLFFCSSSPLYAYATISLSIHHLLMSIWATYIFGYYK